VRWRESCRQVVLATHSFQAPGFNEKLGLRRLFAIEDYPHGYAQLFYRRKLEGRDSGAASRVARVVQRAAESCRGYLVSVQLPILLVEIPPPPCEAAQQEPHC
jgi:hypothetical protein